MKNIFPLNFYILVAGSRSFSDFELLCYTIDELIYDYKNRYRIDSCIIVQGGAKGADFLAKKYADYRNYECLQFDADWANLGKSAGYVRNEEMHKFISNHRFRYVVTFWDGISKGTSHNFRLCNKYCNPLKLVRF